MSCCGLLQSASKPYGREEKTKNKNKSWMNEHTCCYMKYRSVFALKFCELFKPFLMNNALKTNKQTKEKY